MRSFATVLASLAAATVTWSSTDESVATVDGAGRVEAVGVGETEVTASGGGASDAATVIVDQSAASVSVSPALSELRAIGDSASLSAIVRDANGNAIDGAAVEWTSADDGVATVDGGGWAFAQANGTAAITAAVGEISDDAAVVVEQRVASVQVSPAADSAGEGDAVQLDAVAADANGAEVAGRTVVWTTSDPAAASVDGSGNVTGVVRGADATMTATLDGVSGTADVHVLDQMAFLSHRDGAYDDVYIMNADGSGQANVTNNAAVDLDPAWSPDGTQIAGERSEGSDEEIWVVNADGSGVRNLSESVDDSDLAWRPRP